MAKKFSSKNSSRDWVWNSSPISKTKKILISAVGIILFSGLVLSGYSLYSERQNNFGARTDNFWNLRGGTYLETAISGGYNILINGTNKYLNFNTTSGTNGYGIRDNGGTIELKNSGGSWSAPGGSGTVTSVGITVPTGLTVSGVPITNAGTSTITYTAGYEGFKTASGTIYQTAYDDRLKWDGGATGLTAATGRTSLGLGTMALLPDTGSSSITTIGTLGQNLKFSGDYAISRNTTDGSDDGVLTIGGGGATSASRGAYLELKGNENFGTLALYPGIDGNLRFIGSSIWGSMSYAGAFDFGGAPSFEIPNSATNVLTAAGQIGIDTDSDQFRFYGSGGTSTLMGKFDKSFWIASTTPDKSGLSFSTATSTFEVWNPRVAVELTNLYCKTDTGTVLVQCGDGTNWTEPITCSSSGVADDGSITNGAFTAREDFQCRAGTSASSPNKVTVTPTFKYTTN